MTKRYEKLLEVSQSINEANDCAVKAVAISASADYKYVRSLFRKHGRRDGHGTTQRSIYGVVGELGMQLELFSPRQPNWSRYTMCTIGKFCSQGRWIVLTAGHAAAVVDGTVEDWTAGRRHRVIEVFRVTKKPNNGVVL